MKLRRSLLFVCGDDPRALGAARGAGADSLILDLEDTVPPDRKPAARQGTEGFLRAGAHAELAVRVNGVATPWFEDDVRGVVAAGAEALLIPKVESPDDLRGADERLARAEHAAGRAPGSVRLLALIETPRGVLEASAIAAVSGRLDALVIGHVDLSRALGIREAGATDGTILHARCQLVLAAKAAGREAIDAVFMDVDDPEGFRAEARQGLRLGFSGKLLVDARQVPLVHQVYAPAPEEIAYAERLVAAFEAARAEGRGLFLFEGRAVDLPVVEAERTVLERARRSASGG